jgi:hypothetical protein
MSSFTDLKMKKSIKKIQEISFKKQFQCPFDE